MIHDPNNDPFWAGTKYAAAGVRVALERAYARRDRDEGRIRIWYGDTDTGRAWQEEYDVLGYVGRSMGTQKVPLLIFSRRSIGGGAILTKNIVRIDWVKGSHALYKHPTFSSGFEHARIGTTPPGRDWGRRGLSRSSTTTESMSLRSSGRPRPGAGWVSCAATVTASDHPRGLTR